MKYFKKMLESGKPQIGIFPLFECPEMIESLINQKWSWVWLDGQHVLRLHTWLDHIRACNIIDAVPIVRVPRNDEYFIGHALDLGIFDIIVPMIDSEEEAKQVVEAAYFPPLGSRSSAGTRQYILEDKFDEKDISERTTVIVQIETAAGLKNVNEIAATKGISALFIGTGDLSLDLGIPLSLGRKSETIENAIKKVGKAARDNGKYAGLILNEPDEISKRIEQGYSFFSLQPPSDIFSKSADRFLKDVLKHIE